jgi:hypothetical protein
VVVIYKYIFLLFTDTGRYIWQKLSSELERLLDYCEDSDVHVKQSLLMSLLGLSNDKKNTLTRAIKEIFPHSTKRKKVVGCENMYPFESNTIAVVPINAV